MRFRLFLAAILLILGTAPCSAQVPITIDDAASPITIDTAGEPITIYQLSLDHPTPLLGWKDFYSLSSGLGALTEIDAINTGRVQRIRQNGTVERVEFAIGSKPFTVSLFQVVVSRKNGSNYDTIGTSENLAPRLISNTTNSLVLARPIDSVQEGDYVGYRVRGSAGVDWLNTVTGYGGTIIADSGVYPGASFNWDNGAQTFTVSGDMFPIGIGMRAPFGVSISNSIFDGIPSNTSHLDVTTGTDRLNCFPCVLSDSLGVPVANHGKSGNQTYAMVNRFTSDVLAYDPEMVMIEGGSNDIKGFDADGLQNGYRKYHAHITANLKRMMDTTIAHNKIPVWFGIFPRGDYDNAHNAVRDSVNATMAAYVVAVGGVYIPAADSMGVFQTGGPAGNRREPNPLYFDIPDGNIHFKHAGVAYIVALSLPYIRPILAASDY